MTTSATTATQRLHEERQRLERLRDGLHHDGFGRQPYNEAISEIAPAGQHQADVATEMFETEAGTTILGDVEDEIIEVDRALERVAAGTYGFCAVCTEPIPDERLNAVPATRFCVRHEERWEVGGGYSNTAMTNPRDLDGGFLPDDDDNDDLTEPVDQSPEDAAMHVDDGAGWQSEDDEPETDSEETNAGASNTQTEQR